MSLHVTSMWLPCDFPQLPLTSCDFTRLHEEFGQCFKFSTFILCEAVIGCFTIFSSNRNSCFGREGQSHCVGSDSYSSVFPSLVVVMVHWYLTILDRERPSKLVQRKVACSCKWPGGGRPFVHSKDWINRALILMQARISCGIHGFPKLSLEPAMPYHYMLCRWPPLKWHYVGGHLKGVQPEAVLLPLLDTPCHTGLPLWTVYLHDCMKAAWRQTAEKADLNMIRDLFILR
jgi:hypothetical protein